MRGVCQLGEADTLSPPSPLPPQTLSFDSVADIREKVVGHMFDLLYQRPERERDLLDQLVNKLGDPVRQVASKAMLFLLKLRAWG